MLVPVADGDRTDSEATCKEDVPSWVRQFLSKYQENSRCAFLDTITCFALPQTYDKRRLESGSSWSPYLPLLCDEAYLVLRRSIVPNSVSCNDSSVPTALDTCLMYLEWPCYNIHMDLILGMIRKAVG